MSRSVCEVDDIFKYDTIYTKTVGRYSIRTAADALIELIGVRGDENNLYERKSCFRGGNTILCQFYFVCAILVFFFFISYNAFTHFGRLRYKHKVVQTLSTF